jgi:hypothetical protein
MKPLPVVAVLLLAAVAAPTDAAASFAQLEQRLLQSDLDLTVHGLTTGTLDANIDATVAIAPPKVRIDVKGIVGPKTSTYFWLDNDHHDPAAVQRAVVIAWLRMGITHNLVRLLSNQEIEHVEGGIEDMVQVSAVHYDPETRTYAFHIIIGGHDLSKATLELDPRNRPVHRLQTVHFPNGDMKVEETYVWK